MPEGAGMTYRYEVTVERILSSPAHNYFTRPRFEPGDTASVDHLSVPLQSGRGIAGDRFEHSRYPITLFSREVADLIEEAHGRSIDAALFRRNIVVSGINLSELVGVRFRLGGVLFEGVGHCAPCLWMDAAIGKGTYALMRGRGGLRAGVVEGGLLQRGTTLLACGKTLTMKPAASAPKRRLP